MELVISYVKRNLQEIENPSNTNRKVQIEQLENYLAKLKKGISDEDWKKLIIAITLSEAGKVRLRNYGMVTPKKSEVKIIVKFDKYYKEYVWKIRTCNMSISKRVVRTAREMV